MNHLHPGIIRADALAGQGPHGIGKVLGLEVLESRGQGGKRTQPFRMKHDLTDYLDVMLQLRLPMHPSGRMCPIMCLTPLAYREGPLGAHEELLDPGVIRRQRLGRLRGGAGLQEL